MQLLWKFKKILYVGFRATLNFQKIKVVRPEAFLRLDSEHAQSDGKSVNRGLPELDLARGRDPCR